MLLFFYLFLWFSPMKISRAARNAINHLRTFIVYSGTWSAMTNRNYCANSNAPIVIKRSNSSTIWRNTFASIRAKSHSDAEIVGNVFHIPAHTPAIWHRRSVLVPALNWIAQLKWTKMQHKSDHSFINNCQIWIILVGLAVLGLILVKIII